MRIAVGILCAGLLLSGAGCAWDFGSTRVEADVRVDEQALDATLDEAAARVQKELRRLGLEVTAAPEGDCVRVASKTKAGDRFAVVLTRGRSASGREQTRVRVEWGARPDRELWLGLLLALGTAAAQGPG